METPSTAELLQVWEEQADRTLPERAVALLRLARPDLSPDGLVDLPIGARDAALFAFRERLFGPRVEGVATCAACGELLEVTLHAAAPSDLLGPAATAGANEVCSLLFRAPTTRDLIAVLGEVDPETARRRLVTRCVVRTSQTELPGPEADLTPELIDEGARAMALADPAADVVLGVTCPTCSRFSQTPFDVVSFLWQELDAWAARLFEDVHTLASAFGWSEADILALSPSRREVYLKRVLA